MNPDWIVFMVERFFMEFDILLIFMLILALSNILGVITIQISLNDISKLLKEKNETKAQSEN